MIITKSMLRQLTLPNDLHITTRQGKNTAKASFCLICHAEARIVNYGALSCYSCKTFFRRHGLPMKNIRPCQYEGHCHISEQTRKLCTSCRLVKCLAMGMSVDFIRKEYRKKKYRSVMKFNRKEMNDNIYSVIYIQSVTRITSLSLLSQDRSSLDQSEWNSLSNVIHAFDKFSLVPSMGRMIEHVNMTQSRITVDISDTFNLFAAFYTSVKSFMNVTADFQILTVDEQSSLFQRNLHGLFNLCGTFMLRDAGMFDNSRNESIIVPLYGHEIVRQAKRIITRLDFDSTLVKIIHIVFAFSTNCYTVNYDPTMTRDALIQGAFRLLGSQNAYVDILWKYMIYRYGYDETVLRFAALVKQMLDLIILSAGIYNENVHHQILVDDLVEEARTALVLDKGDVVSLWGRT